MTDIPSMRKPDQPLGAALWFFIVFKSFGILINLQYIAMQLFWAVPTMASLPGTRTFMSQFVIQNVVLPSLEIVATGFGIMLIVRRYRNMRKFWITFLLLYCLVHAVDLVVGFDFEGALFFLLTGLAWLGYWIMAKRPRELQLNSLWNTR